MVVVVMMMMNDTMMGCHTVGLVGSGEVANMASMACRWWTCDAGYTITHTPLPPTPTPTPTPIGDIGMTSHHRQ
jgi:hypothetical protein